MNETSEKQQHDDSSLTVRALREMGEKEKMFVKEFEVRKVVKLFETIFRVKYI